MTIFQKQPGTLHRDHSYHFFLHLLPFQWQGNYSVQYWIFIQIKDLSNDAKCSTSNNPAFIKFSLEHNRQNINGKTLIIPVNGFLHFNHSVFWSVQHTCQVLTTADCTPHIINYRYSLDQVQSINGLSMTMTTVHLCNAHKLLFSFFRSFVYKALL